MADELHYYEPRFWGLDPVFSAKVKLNIIDIHGLNPHPIITEVYCISNHPVQSVQVMGDVVSIQKKSKMIKYEIDDGSGVLHCTQWREREDSDKGLFVPQLGQLVTVWGKLTEFREEKQLTVNGMAVQEDPNAEPLHWLEAAHLMKTVYTRPFTPHPNFLFDPTKAADVVPLKQKIQLAVERYLKESLSGKHFTLAELCDSAELFEYCLKNVAASCDSTQHQPQEVRYEVGGVVRELTTAGVIVVAVGTGKQKEPKYEIFSSKKHLHPLILEFIQSKERIRESVSRLGVAEEWIVKFIQQKEAFRHISTAVILNTIAELVENSLIYPFTPNSYKIVT